MRTKIIRLAIVAAPGCIGSTVHGLLDAFACANSCAAAEKATSGISFKISIVSPDGESVRSYNGHTINADGNLKKAEGADIILLAPIMPATAPGEAIISKAKEFDSVLTWLRAQSRGGSCIATSCTGSFLLAEAGLLDGKVATTHWRAAHAFRARYPEVVLRESDLITESGNIVCSGGAVSYIDLAIHLIRRFGGSSLALRCARMLVFDPGRDRQSPYLAFEPEKAHGDKTILKAQEWLETNYWRDIDVESISGLLGMSSRNFKRRFKAACGEPMTTYLQRIRLAASCDRLASSDARIQQIIFDVGYTDASSFCRLFKEFTGLTMGDYRKRFWSKTDAHTNQTRRPKLRAGTGRKMAAAS